MARILIALCLSLLLTGCAGPIGTMLYVQPGQAAELKVSPFRLEAVPSGASGTQGATALPVVK